MRRGATRARWSGRLGRSDSNNNNDNRSAWVSQMEVVARSAAIKTNDGQRDSSGIESHLRPMPTRNRYYIETFGCQMNVNDSEKVAGLLEAEGYEATSLRDNAD